MVGNWWKNWQSMEMWGKGRIYLKMAGVQRWKYGHQWEQEEIRSNLDNKNSRCKLSRMIGTNKIILQYIPYITGLLLTSVPASHSLQGGHFPWALSPPCSIFPFNVFVSNLSPICLHLFFFLLRCVCVCTQTLQFPEQTDSSFVFLSESTWTPCPPTLTTWACYQRGKGHGFLRPIYLFSTSLFRQTKQWYQQAEVHSTLVPPPSEISSFPHSPFWKNAHAITEWLYINLFFSSSPSPKPDFRPFILAVKCNHNVQCGTAAWNNQHMAELLCF